MRIGYYLLALAAALGVLVVAVAVNQSPVEDTFPEVFSQETSTRYRLERTAESLERYWQRYGALPTTLSAADDSLKAMSGILDTDEWQTPIRYTFDGALYCLASSGSDTVFGTDDDIKVAGSARGAPRRDDNRRELLADSVCSLIDPRP
jgi:hypothetical protein